MNIEILYGAANPESERAGLAESPLWDDQRQCWFWIDIPKRRIHRHSDAEHRVWQLPQRDAFDPGAIALSDSGELLLALRAGIARLNPDIESADITPEIWIAAPYDTATTRFNDGGVDAQGRWWIGSLFAPKTHAGAGLYCLERGELKAILGEQATQKPWQDWGVTTANGWAMSPDGTRVYHADTQAHTVYRYDFSEKLPVESALSHRQVFVQTVDTRQQSNPSEPYQGRPDGAVVDSAGNYWGALFEGGQIVQTAPDGTVLQKIALPAKCPTMPCFGGADLKTLIITTTGDRPVDELAQYPANGFILSIQLPVAGLPTRRYHPQ